MDIRPYYSPYKIYIIADADLMTPQAQNALLKTIEEPPEYAVILLLTNNIGGLLPTIQSRCVRLDLKVVDDGLVKKYLMEHLQCSGLPGGDLTHPLHRAVLEGQRSSYFSGVCRDDSECTEDS